MSNWLQHIEAVDGKPHEILIYDRIGKDFLADEGFSAKDFADTLKKIPAKDSIHVRINSPGGNVWDGLAIYNQLKQRREKVTCFVDGVAASIASVIAMAGNKVVMPANSWMMIHDASTLWAGNAAEMREMADKLDRHSDMLAGIYAEKTGKSRDSIRAMMREETWFEGTQAKEMGLADELTAEVKLAATISNPGFRRVPEVFGKTVNTPPPLAAGQHTGETVQTEKIIALLKEHGKNIEANATSEQLLAGLKELITAGKVTQAAADALKQAPANVIIPENELRAMQAQVAQQREMRLRSEFRVLAQDRPYLDESKYMKLLLTATDEGEKTIMDSIREMPVTAGATPVKPSIQNLGNSLIEQYRAMAPGKERQVFHVKHWQSLEDAMAEQRITAMASLPIQEQLRRLHDPRNVASNTFESSLVTDFLADAFITTIGTRLAPLNAFSRNFGNDRTKPKATVQVPKATVASTTLTDATDFEQYDSTTTNVAITMNQYTQPFAVTNEELNSGHRLITIAAKNAQAFANKISDIWTADVTTGNFGAAISIGAAANFDTADLGPILEVAKNYGTKNLILDGGHWAYLLPQTRENFSFSEQAGGAFGFDLIAMQNRWTGATANTVGFVCDPNAIAVAASLPAELPTSEFIELGTVTVEDLNITAQVCHWFSRKARTHFMSYDIMFGSSPGDTTAGELLAST